jgi:3-hydroxyacyl-CoA dehydrogenase
MSEFVRYAVHDDPSRGSIAILTIDNPPVNAMTPSVAQGIVQGVGRAIDDPAIRAVVLTGAGKNFMAGADIKDFGDDAASARLLVGFTSATRALENCPKPVVAAINGSALGGGLEVAMSAHYRVLASNAQVGQPEVKLGLIPGAGGTQRLPRLAGVAMALEMCVLGAPIRAQEAMEAGIGDRVIEGDLEAGALAFAYEVTERPRVRTCDRNEKLREVDTGLFEEASNKAHKSMRGQTAPLAAIDAIDAAVNLNFREGMRREAYLFERCRRSAQAKALIHVFFGERAVSKIPDLPADTPAAPIETAAVIGAGTMGGGIAMALADAGIAVRVKEANEQALERGMQTIRANYGRSLKNGRLTEEAMEQRLARMTPQLTDDGFDQADLIIEAAYEDLSVKKQIFSEIGKIAKAECILATNTSSLDIDEIARAGGRPENTLGLHFFSPANVMKLLEVVRGGGTSHTALATAMTLAKRLNKIAVLAGNCHGFIGNRMIEMYGREAQFLVEEGATVEQVNQALYDFGMPMGPLAMYDLVGNDVMRAIEKGSPALNAPSVRKPVVLDQLLKQGRLGQKSGKGWSQYDDVRKPSPDTEVEILIRTLAKKAGFEQREITAEEIMDRCVLALVNEGARILEEGIALRSVDIDIVYVTGFGFPAWRGGPMFFADTLSVSEVLARLERFRERHGAALWEPAKLLREIAETDGRFETWRPVPA